MIEWETYAAKIRALKSVLKEVKHETWDTSKDFADGWNSYRSKVVREIHRLEAMQRGLEKPPEPSEPDETK